MEATGYAQWFGRMLVKLDELWVGDAAEIGGDGAEAEDRFAGCCAYPRSAAGEPFSAHPDSLTGGAVNPTRRSNCWKRGSERSGSRRGSTRR